MNTDALKAAFRRRAAELGIDAERGATSYQAAALKAAERKRTHYDRARQAVYANAERFTPEDSYETHEHVSIRGSRCMSATPRLLTRYHTHWDNGNGAVDWVKVERQARRDWWAFSGYWKGGARRLVVARPKWTKAPVRVVDRDYVDIVRAVSMDDDLLELIAARIPPTDQEAFQRVRRAARMLECRAELEHGHWALRRKDLWLGEVTTRAEDKHALWREAWSEAKIARPVQLAFDWGLLMIDALELA